ncbi:GxxExxY protein [Mariniblastus fucicola]|uniref:GxxExxY protein n=1 Tax=Mariniblastus fucicola TaxID=980251 RepID=A0A5B9PB92_9BACT|nr:GxxExxY protein [Mariniblastus fucicola]QEG23554.1 hypothetical protein MFFC18_34550 [Mariniblastus fucicola]
MDLLFKDESYQIMGACFEVYKNKGCGFVEQVYQECLSLEFGLQAIPFAEQVELTLEYKGKQLEQTYKPDFICFDEIIVEIKAVSKLNDQHRAQVHNYLEAWFAGELWSPSESGVGANCALTTCGLDQPRNTPNTRKLRASTILSFRVFSVFRGSKIHADGRMSDHVVATALRGFAFR